MASKFFKAKPKAESKKAASQDDEDGDYGEDRVPELAKRAVKFKNGFVIAYCSFGKMQEAHNRIFAELAACQQQEEAEALEEAKQGKKQDLDMLTAAMVNVVLDLNKKGGIQVELANILSGLFTDYKAQMMRIEERKIREAKAGPTTLDVTEVDASLRWTERSHLFGYMKWRDDVKAHIDGIIEQYGQVDVWVFDTAAVLAVSPERVDIERAANTTVQSSFEYQILSDVRSRFGDSKIWIGSGLLYTDKHIQARPDGTHEPYGFSSFGNKIGEGCADIKKMFASHPAVRRGLVRDAWTDAPEVIEDLVGKYVSFSGKAKCGCTKTTKKI